VAIVGGGLSGLVTASLLPKGTRCAHSFSQTIEFTVCFCRISEMTKCPQCDYMRKHSVKQCSYVVVYLLTLSVGGIHRWVLLEASPQLGGRLKNAEGLGEDHLHVDMGAAWCWPSQQPKVRALLQSLSLKSFEQPDDGGGHTHRVHGGTYALVAALAAQVAPLGEVHMNWPLQSCAHLPASSKAEDGAGNEAPIIKLTNQAGEVRESQLLRRLTLSPLTIGALFSLVLFLAMLVFIRCLTYCIHMFPCALFDSGSVGESGGAGGASQAPRRACHF